MLYEPIALARHPACAPGWAFYIVPLISKQPRTPAEEKDPFPVPLPTPWV
jgi:hypothetical protein